MPALDRTEAVNMMLFSVGEQAVDAAEVATPTDSAVVQATRTLDDANRTVQLMGWSFNRERNVTLTPDGSSKIILDADVTHVDPCAGNGQYAIRRNGADMSLYDRYDNTFLFTGAVRVELQRIIDYDDVPEVGKQFIMSKAAAAFAERYLGESQPSLLRDAALAEAMFINIESEMSDLRLSDAYDVHRTTGRQSPLDGHSA